ncbi:lysylphosphatidylglycerol synthase transmembrane domain-containing protein [Halosolutus halophilus]|uniref:lysylphosphatidylglycerol synthase transmembrane domain-containing protein n=1 Tax=Halosolutus halophilus TaxID=1552990 RepID=UPI002235196D|nr:lysylphosphatidylglycerol synthase transmembrane domain-containing protein [Halosolutus halophilus]
MVSDSAKTAVRIVVSVTLVAGIFYSAGPGRILSVVLDVRPEYYTLAVALVFVGIVVSTIRWRLLLGAKRENVALYSVFKIYYIGGFSNLFLPSTIGGDVVKSVAISRSLDERMEAYSSVVVNRFCGLLALGAIALVAVLLSPDLLNRRIWEAVVLLITGILMFPIFVVGLSMLPDRIDRLGDLIGIDPLRTFNSFLASIAEYRTKPKTLVMVISLALFFQVLGVFANYAVAQGLNLPVPLAYLFITVPITQVLLLVPVSIHGHGVREGLFVFFYTQVGLTVPEAVGFSVTIFTVILITYSFGAVFLLTGRQRNTASVK